MLLRKVIGNRVQFPGGPSHCNGGFTCNMSLSGFSLEKTQCGDDIEVRKPAGQEFDRSFCRKYPSDKHFCTESFSFIFLKLRGLIVHTKLLLRTY